MVSRSSKMTGTRLDDPARFNSPTRREFLRVGMVGGVGLSLGDCFTLRAARAAEGASRGPAAEAVIQIFLGGGISHLDTFDPKPDAPIEIRGELGVVKTRTGEHFSGLMRQTAAIADKIAVIRSFSHGEAAHERGIHSMLTGHRSSPLITYPSIGSVVAHEHGLRTSLPPYVCVPGADNEYLSTGYLSPADGASSLISSKEARAASDLNAEDGRIRDEYGRSAIGQRLLIARRLVEAGARFVTVLHGGWDMHQKIHDGMRARLPAVDQGFAALIRDLDRRGLLSRTLVAWTSEFGRSTRINRDAGRDHWANVFSVAMAGGGVKGGQIVGRSDPTGSEPADRPVGPADMAATLFTQLGISPEKELMSPGNRPIEIVRHGKVIDGLV